MQKEICKPWVTVELGASSIASRSRMALLCVINVVLRGPDRHTALYRPGAWPWSPDQEGNLGVISLTPPQEAKGKRARMSLGENGNSVRLWIFIQCCSMSQPCLHEAWWLSGPIVPYPYSSWIRSREATEEGVRSEGRGTLSHSDNGGYFMTYFGPRQWP
jgi:hypothetical protein